MQVRNFWIGNEFAFNGIGKEEFYKITFSKCLE